MGLAASQARLLFITSRQSDVSAKMQRISNDKMTLARDEDDVYEQYNRMLTQQVYQTEDGANISYNALMGRAAGKNGIYNIIQNSEYAVVLSTELASKFGLTQPNGSGEDFKHKHSNVESLIDTAESAEDAAKIKAQLVNAGGDPPPGTEVWEDSQEYQTFIATYGADCPENGNIAVPIDDVVTFTTISSPGNTYNKYSGQQDPFGANGAGAVRARLNSAVKADYAANATVTSAISNLVNSLSTEFVWGRNGEGKYFWDNNTAYNRMASDVSAKSNGKFGIVYAYTSYQGKPSNNITYTGIGIDYTQIAARFRTQLGGTSGNINIPKTNTMGKNYTEWKTAEASAKKAFNQRVSGGNPSNDPDTINLNLANYYKNLWTNLADNGWTTQSAETIQANLNQGLYYINGTKISESDKYTHKADQDAKDQADIYLERELKKIKRKEDKMETDLTKLQTEYSSLTKDYDSVKSIIDANVQKSFSYCSQ
ncbi:hypothetical protein IKE67_07065 [bacterium]|nr:hypothetical protein [bacterium]